jgi:hypothetical protein
MGNRVMVNHSPGKSGPDNRVKDNHGRSSVQMCRAAGLFHLMRKSFLPVRQ